ncbi:HAD family hydrolase [Jeotgalibacillus marinus]|uniref:HAD hydrolase-like protein n=1 Tax=Jeotgalibacillus marinus TaxID=86667 RepID=A0ABV3Q5Q4_9BACL
MALLILDLDGTLVDSTDYDTEAIHLAIEGMPHIEEPTRELVQSAYGLANGDYWAKVAPGASAQDITRIRSRRSTFLDQLVKGNDLLFPGVRETLAKLKEQGHILTTASNCGIHYLNMMLDSQNIRHYFTHPICLGTINGEKKADILTAHFDHHFLKENVYMIGDRYSDIEAAREHNIPSVICTYGFGDQEEWQKADYKIDKVEDLLCLIK